MLPPPLDFFLRPPPGVLGDEIVDLGDDIGPGDPGGAGGADVDVSETIFDDVVLVVAAVDEARPGLIKILSE